MDVASFDEIGTEFLERVSRMVWCNVATLDRRNRLRSRITHPIWEGAHGWIGTRRETLKARHLAHHPFVSLAYIADVAKPVYVDCRAEWDDSLEGRQQFWERCLATPAPLGYDPAPIFQQVDNPNWSVIRLLPWRIELSNFPSPALVWRDLSV
jgi:hypothetical protein